MSERHNKTAFASEICVGCTAHHWAVGTRALLCILTIGLSELLRGKDGWCGAFFSSEGGSEPRLPRPPYQNQNPTEGDWSSRMSHMDNTTGQRVYPYPMRAYHQGEPDRQIYGSIPQPQSPATGEQFDPTRQKASYPMGAYHQEEPDRQTYGSIPPPQSPAAGEQFGSPPPVSPIAQ
ncbi:hypothetical protein B0J13DRAFT_531223 [Dactylonectria estremocensis]|uniref:Uncharacterized protein n=1 Tax=Dactylonectria estremocensis TaxID=1079267 RepID=A0A9P9ILM4_9HYPO|nr:hypothetical protein B0J13DRAFT_531223 [Dactylonectria estremocensis]